MKRCTLARNAASLLLTFVVAAPALAQDKRVEVNPFFGYSFSEGFTVNSHPDSRTDL